MTGRQPPAGFLDRWARPVADRTATLTREGGGRLDRLDVWLILVLFVATLGLRTFRLGEPYRMHFDEVYHARTAAEFLQDWRYGMPHAIYEWTHPHLAKYAMAGGLVLLGENRVVAEARLGTAVRDAALEPRWDRAAEAGDAGAPDAPALRAGERLYVATGSELLVLDLRTRAGLAAFPVPGASAVAVDQAGHRVFVGTTGGQILVGDSAVTAAAVRAAASGDAGASGVAPATFATAGAAVERLWVVADGAYVVALTPGGTLVTFDAVGGAELGRVTLAGAADVADAGSTDALVADPAAVGDAQVAAAELAALLGGAQADYLPLLQSDVPEVTVSADLGDSRTKVEDAIANGTLTGFSIRPIARLAIADAAGVSLVEPSSGTVVGAVPLDAPATGLARVEGIEDDPQLWVAAGSDVAVLRLARSSTTGLPVLDRTVPLPGTVERIAFDSATELVHVLGRTPDGSAATVYVIEPRGSSVFADARLPFTPAAWAGDWDGNFPAADREQLLLFAADGSAAAVATGQNAFAWRFPGVLAGALMAVLVFLLARILFRRRAVAVFAGLFTLLDGMFFVQSRIGMNDAYVGAFLLAAIVLFAGLWTGRWRARWAFWVGMPAIGLLLGLALASKWVALYAIGGLGILVLARSALGRVLLVLGLAAITALLGYLAIAVPPANFTFLAIMVGLTLLAAAVTVLHPIAWAPEEVRFAVGAPLVLGIVACLAAIPLRANASAAAAVEPGATTPLGPGDIALYGGIAFLLVGAGAFAAFAIAGRFGWGPLAGLPEPDDPAALLEPPVPAPDGWLRLGSGWGIPAAWLALCLLVIPVVVYVVSYIPWFALGNQLVEGVPAGHTGQTLLDLTKSMYDYHNNLRATHAASSPWWAWPLDLKPVWFFQGGFAGATSGAIYDAGNLAIWWLSIPALAFAAWQAFRRRSLALALTGVMFAVMWLSWSRIDRATFQYHYYTALPFAILALGYLVAELWHGPSRRTWLLARAAAAIAVLGPAILWLLLRPLCWFVDVERANAGSWACTAAPALGPEISWQAIAVGAVLLGGGLLVGWLVARLRRANRPDASSEERGPALARVAGALIGLGIAVVGALNLVGPEPAFALGGIPRELAALVLAVPLGVVAVLVFTVRSPRRFAVGSVIAAGLFFLLLYPNWSGLPLPNSVFNAYQLLLPTWQYAFQFPVNTAEVTSVSLVDPMPALLFGAIVVAGAFIGYSAWTWRLVAAERAADEAAPGGEGE